jgi:hypothetical protein
LQVEFLESHDVPSTGFTLGPLVQVSGPSPFAAFQPPLLDAETEPTVAVNPTNPNNVVAAWIQDYAAGIVGGVSFDGGGSWQPVVIPGLTAYSGGPSHQLALDPWLSFAPDGELYAVCVAGSPEPNGAAFQHAHTGPLRILASTSADGGLHWSAPATLIDDHGPAFTDDKPSITADPTDPNYAYAVWYRGNADSGRHNETMFARTTDGGRTWEAPRVIDNTTGDAARKGHQVLVEPDGTLVILVEEDVYHGTSTDVFLSSLRSTDRGATWLAPLRGPEMVGQYDLAIDPETGEEIGNGHADYAVGPNNGTLYAVWNDTRFLGAPYDSIGFSMSGDGGLTWSAPVKINQTPTTIPVGNQQAFLPSVAVAADGTVGLTYYDLRNNTLAAGLPTDYWFIHADPRTDLTNPASWSQELRLTNTSFDVEAAPLPFGDFFLGDYAGLADAGNDFVPAWVMPHANPDGTLDPDSVFSRRVIAGAPLEAASLPTMGPSVTATPAGRQTLLPFRGHGSGGFTDASGGFFATGIATHLGAFTHYGMLVLTPTADPLVFAVSGRTVYQAANGDLLYAVTDATLNVLTGVVTGTDTWDGGAGRFADASGVVDLSAQLLPDGSVTFSLLGSIAF